MNVRKERPRTAQEAQVPYQPPQQLLVHCPHCDGVVLRGCAKAGGVTEWYEWPQNPLGGVHDCQVALSWTLTVQGLRWNTVRLVAQQRLVTTQEGH